MAALGLWGWDRLKLKRKTAWAHRARRLCESGVLRRSVGASSLGFGPGSNAAGRHNGMVRGVKFACARGSAACDGVPSAEPPSGCGLFWGYQPRTRAPRFGPFRDGRAAGGGQRAHRREWRQSEQRR